VILIPVKILKNAKQRLSAVLDQPARFAIAQAMVHDVAETIHAWENRPETALVTSDPFALELAKQLDFQVIPDDFNRSETAAIEMATHIATERGASFTLVIPGDIPLVTAKELQAVMDAAPSAGSVLVPATDGRGTNAALRSPADLFPLRFGNDSFRPHLAAARITRRPCVVLSLPGIGLDVDNPSDLRQLVIAPGTTRSQLLARQWNLDELPLAANE
jgi:2-phospho-L-lactate/phosphoenolpyruvate guanylyltransferase